MKIASIIPYFRGYFLQHQIVVSRLQLLFQGIISLTREHRYLFARIDRIALEAGYRPDVGRTESDIRKRNHLDVFRNAYAVTFARNDNSYLPFPPDGNSRRD